MKHFFRAAAPIAFYFVALQVAATPSKSGISAEIERVDVEIRKIEADEQSKAAAGEIAVARLWIEQARSLMKRGEVEKAAVFAERLSAQLVLLRAMIAAGSVLKKAEELERTLFAKEQQLKLLKAGYDRLWLRKNGAKVIDAGSVAKEKGR